MHWYEIIADPDRPADELASVWISGDTSEADGIAWLAEVVRREGSPEEIALWVDGQWVGVCKTEEILAQTIPVLYRHFGRGDGARLPGTPQIPDEAEVPKYTCPRCGESAYIPFPSLAKCDNNHPVRAMEREG